MGLRLAYLCMESTFSVRPLEALLAAGHDVRFVLRPLGPLSTRNDQVLRRHRGFDVAMRRLLGIKPDEHKTNPLAVAADRDIPAWLCGSVNTPMVEALLTRERVDLMVISFFNQLLKPQTLQATPLGALNLHPSLLPKLRGPAPLFWTFRDQHEEAGLTIHRVSPGEDDGDVVMALPHPLPFGISGEDLVDDLANSAADNIVDAVAMVEGGVPGQPQDPTLATRAPRPTSSDVVIDPAWTARRIFGCARGVGRWNNLVVVANNEVLRVIDAVDIDIERRLPGEHAIVGDELLLGAADGVVRLKIRRERSS
jgi:methionyl-tRNA formyltransferase